MKEKVYVNIKGLHLQSEGQDNNADTEEAIEVIHVGRYKVVNGKEYIKYDEVYEGESDKCSCMIKINGDQVEITKKGAITAHLSFIEGEKTMTFYDTPYGNLYLGVFARSIKLERSEDRIYILIDYALELNYEQVSDCKVEIEISSNGSFSLENTGENK